MRLRNLISAFILLLVLAGVAEAKEKPWHHKPPVVTPEPVSSSLFVIGGAVIAFLRRRK